MSRTYGLRTARDLLAKLERDAELLRQEVSSDRFFNFVVTAYSLVYWIQNDPSVNSGAKSDLQRFRSTQSIQICRDLANLSKHFSLDPRRNPNPKVQSAASDQGFGVGRFGVGGYGVGEEEISVVLDNGATQDSLALIEDALRDWKTFFVQHALTA